VVNGYDDWFLPSRDEAAEIKRVLADYNMGGFDHSHEHQPSIYWSSSEINYADSFTIQMAGKNEMLFTSCGKYLGFRVRAVRAF